MFACALVGAACSSADAEPTAQTLDLSTSTTADPGVSTPSTGPAIDDPVAIMAFGDSITEAPQYRAALVDRLTVDGCAFDMVGSRNRFDDEVADADHEGYARWSALELSDIARDRASDASPDIAIVHAGTNDLAGGVEPAIALERLERIVEELRSGAPGISVIVAQIIPYAADQGEVAIFNGLVADFVERTDASAQRVVVADVFTGFVVDEHTRDGIHPNDEGGDRLAAVFDDALRSLGVPCRS